MKKIDYEITVDVRGLSVEEKKRVQDAFFKLGFKWLISDDSYELLNDKDVNRYTNWWARGGRTGALRWTYSDNRAPTHTPEQLFELAGMNNAPEGMEPFDLERALAGDPVVTRDGREVMQIRLFDSVTDGSPVAGVVGGFLFTFSRNGESETYSRYLFMKPKTHMVNGFEAPAPMAESPKYGCRAWIEVLDRKDYCLELEWQNSRFDKMMLDRGLVHSTKEAAIANAKARLGIDPYAEE